MNELEELSFSQPFNRNLFNSRERSQLQSQKQHAQDTCHNLINDDYIRASFKHFDQGQSQKNAEGHLIGFCLWKEHHSIHTKSNPPKIRSPQIHLLLICAKPSDMKLGEIILQDLEDQCRQRNFQQIDLEAATEGLQGYQERMGQSMQDPQASLLRKVIHPYSTQNRPKQKRTTRKQRRIKRSESVLQEAAITPQEW